MLLDPILLPHNTNTGHKTIKCKPGCSFIIAAWFGVNGGFSSWHGTMPAIIYRRSNGEQVYISNHEAGI
ncbi:hypothetical protein A3860_12120 [Niastella vici]|uniref:Uncharacterized protein n=1 Tax=Niastella vici TaxID=1703345 RepID=A0A1V9G6S5_9BACT|nr:hypothetical protein A3860_12120 [Niastella vici]